MEKRMAVKAEFCVNVSGTPVDVLRVVFNGESCVNAAISWHNDAVMLGLRTMFACNDDEEIVAISMTEGG